MAIIGIDLGTTNSLVCVCQDGRAVLAPNSLGEKLTPSVVSVDENGEICVGAVAKERLISHPGASTVPLNALWERIKYLHCRGTLLHRRNFPPLFCAS